MKKIVDSDKRLIEDEQIVKNYYEMTLTIFDDILFKEAAKNKDFMQELLRVILNDKKLKVLSVRPQMEIDFLSHRSLKLDSFVIFSNNSLANVEVENNVKSALDETMQNKCDHQKRVRFHGSAITMYQSKPNDAFDNVPDLYMVYLTKRDFFKKGKTVYRIERYIEGTGEKVDNGYHEIYVNAENDDKSEIAELMKLLTTKGYYSKKYKVISEVKKEKEDTNMPAEVQEAMERIKKHYGDKGRAEGRAEGKAEGKAEGRTEGKTEGRIEAYADMIRLGLIDEKVALDNLKLSKAEFKRKIKELKI